MMTPRDKFYYYNIEDADLKPIYYIMEKFVGTYFDQIPVEASKHLFIMTGGYGLETIVNDIKGKVDNVEKDVLGNFLIHPYTIQLAHNPQLDNTRLFPKLFPGGPYPISSGTYRVFFAGDLVFSLIPVDKEKYEKYHKNEK